MIECQVGTQVAIDLVTNTEAGRPCAAQVAAGETVAARPGRDPIATAEIRIGVADIAAYVPAAHLDRLIGYFHWRFLHPRLRLEQIGCPSRGGDGGDHTGKGRCPCKIEHHPRPPGNAGPLGSAPSVVDNELQRLKGVSPCRLTKIPVNLNYWTPKGPHIARGPRSNLWASFSPGDGHCKGCNIRRPSVSSEGH